MKHLIKILPLLALTLGACDQPEDSLEFRDLAQNLVITQNDDPDISLGDFVGIVFHCEGIEDPKLAVTFSYHETQPGNGKFALGLGFSAMGGEDLATCWEKYMLELGAHAP